ncbi:alcohol dehydrogenase catalytic domain-containing protein [Arthrobacter sp. zg-Y820]|uniref:zinc-dependent alcohol dehydrogenase n=1 Tax=unclassified Arthrobacter TaxID=235627 RepID=UPI001E65D50C|nr:MULTISPECIES: zinc-binding dehydrogenase [unclassified Arthrobacter]MCC9197583.1 alcohol dehydrogenase catalytic domain-containing protein [Arthrobacter sp. zg-Y820]MDK1280450.1 alcohol dehydrogenase catalytic domain-containing protein [Arthrobacter sp. zg.Y820]WIB10906.1 alcohol dehydrogenase catalytic domain-containing protein [Arthrobacter sp. zg-Y820]
MKAVYVTGPNTNEWVEVDRPAVGPHDVLLKIKACGICGSDAMYSQIGGIPPRQGATPLGHEPAAEVAEAGADVDGLTVGDHVVIDTMAFTDGLLGSGGAQGALSEYVVVRDAEPGRQLKVIPKDIPWEVAALNEPMAVALHAVNRTEPRPGDRVVIFGAGPIGLGALLGYRRRGVSHIVVVDLIPSRLEKALQIGADAVINSADEDVAARLVELHGDGSSMMVRGVRSGTDIFLDAAGAPVIPATVAGIAKQGATLGIVAVHKKPVELDFGSILTTELTIVFAMGYPTEIFEVTEDIIENWQKYALIISDKLPFDRALDALALAQTPGAADKVVVTFE